MRRFIIAAVAAAAVFASAGTPAHAHHDMVCTPPGPAGLPPLCAAGHEHFIADTVAAGPEGLPWLAYRNGAALVDQAKPVLDTVPDPVCAREFCASEQRAAAHHAYDSVTGPARDALYQLACTASPRQECN